MDDGVQTSLTSPDLFPVESRAVCAVVVYSHVQTVDIGRCTVDSVRASDMGEDVAHPLVEMMPNVAKGVSSGTASQLPSVMPMREQGGRRNERDVKVIQ
jgi:hypothetical protein